jgi:hypothetical protein
MTLYFAILEIVFVLLRANFDVQVAAMDTRASRIHLSYISLLNISLRNVLSEYRDLEKYIQITSSSEIISTKVRLLQRFQTVYTGCPGRNVKNFGRVFLMLKYTDITQNTYIQS